MIRTILATAVLSLASLSASATGGNYPTIYQANASASCDAALPVFYASPSPQTMQRSAIRERPLAIVNEGSAPAFVTCAFPSLAYGVETKEVGLSVSNQSGRYVSVTCTGVTGVETDAGYTTRTLDLAPHDRGTLRFAGDKTMPVGVSCALPPGVAVTYTWSEFKQP